MSHTPGQKPEDRRRYVSPLRERQAVETREGILDAAQSLFFERGYAGTSMHDVAVSAGVSDSRVFSLFRDKRSLLWAVGDRVLAGSEQDVPLEQTKLAQDLRAEPDPRQRLKLVMAWARSTYERGIADFESVLYEAMNSDARLGAMKQEILEQRHVFHREVLVLLLGDVPLREGVSLDEAADFVEALDSAPTYKRLTGERGWSMELYEAWMTFALERLFLDGLV